jgi:hypothetical protein
MKMNKSLALHTSAAALLVISGVVTKNTFEQLGNSNHPVGKPLGMILFTLGWIYTAYALSYGKSKKYLYVGPCLGILGAVMLMKKYMADKKPVPKVFPIVFAISWVVLGFLTSNHLSGAMKYSGLVASAAVLMSMMWVLPWQRTKKIVDGPGMPLFTAAWALLIGLNSAR